MNFVFSFHEKFCGSYETDFLGSLTFSSEMVNQQTNITVQNKYKTKNIYKRDELHNMSIQNVLH